MCSRTLGNHQIFSSFGSSGYSAICVNVGWAIFFSMVHLGFSGNMGRCSYYSLPFLSLLALPCPALPCSSLPSRALPCPADSRSLALEGRTLTGLFTTAQHDRIFEKRERVFGKRRQVASCLKYSFSVHSIPGILGTVGFQKEDASEE